MSEIGNMPFMIPGIAYADYDRVNPLYWQSLNKKMDYLGYQGYVHFLVETIMRNKL
jgi:hypothetical protein